MARRRDDRREGLYGPAMSTRLALVTFVVDDYDDAIRWFTDTLGFTLREDTPLGDGKRWVVVGPPEGAGLLLARATSPSQRSAVGNQTGGRVAFFLHTDDFAGMHARLSSRGVRFVSPPRQEPYGTVAVFEDLHGNRWDLVEPKA